MKPALRATGLLRSNRPFRAKFAMLFFCATAFKVLDYTVGRVVKQITRMNHNYYEYIYLIEEGFEYHPEDDFGRLKTIFKSPLG